MRERTIDVTDAKDVAGAISTYVNCSGNATDLAQAMANDHPTLQSSTASVVMEFLRIMSEKTYTDARNEYAVKMAKAAYAAAVDSLNGATRLPFI